MDIKMNYIKTMKKINNYFNNLTKSEIIKKFKKFGFEVTKVASEEEAGLFTEVTKRNNNG